MNRFRAVRIMSGISGATLAAKLNISPGAVSAWENGRCRPSPKRFEKIATALAVTRQKVFEAFYPGMSDDQVSP